MYTKLTKVVKLDDGRECVACAFFGTDKCHIHTDDHVPDCGRCKMFGAMLNLLHAFEEIVEERDR